LQDAAADKLPETIDQHERFAFTDAHILCIFEAALNLVARPHRQFACSVVSAA